MIDPGEDSVGSEYEGSCVHKGWNYDASSFFFFFSFVLGLWEQTD